MFMNEKYIYDNNHTNMYVKNKVYISTDMIDMIAEEKYSQGYNLKRSNLCKKCNMYKYMNGSCNC